MEYDFNQNYYNNEESLESEGDSITIDNNDYEDYSEEFQNEENQNGNKQQSPEKENEKGKNRKSQKNRKIKKSGDLQTENNENDSQEDEEPLKAELQEKLHKVFLNYAKFNAQEENFILSHQYFMKMMKDCGLLREKYEKPKENTLTAEKIDITLKKVCPNNASLNTQQFIDFFVTLSKRLNPLEFNKAPRNTVQQTVERFLDPIVEIINEDQEGKFRYNKVEQSVLATRAEGVDEKTENLSRFIKCV